MKQHDLIICVGELLIDFFCLDKNVSLIDGSNFEKQAGGAPANVSAAVSKLGGAAAFVGMVGNDPFGAFLKKTLEDEQVDTSMLFQTDQAATTLAFVSLQEDGERDFIFNRGADRLLEFNDLHLDRIKEGKIIHFGSATALLEDPFQTTYFQLMDYSIQEGLFVSFDPNYRQALWGGRMEEFVTLAQKGISKAGFVKVSEEELEIIAGSSSKEASVDFLHQLGAKIVAVTLGKNGTLISNGLQKQMIPSIEIKSIDSTGAGDAFVGATLYQLSQLQDLKINRFDIDSLTELIHFSNAVGAMVCTKRGAISSLPTLEEVGKV
ncbi:carbohydrate kinase [Halalkalibacter kiskunsagensis]|uniref:Carbohydrate kinase n=1 Tax=Halalkalibacter kiskunsagensis TaxID=1548599 RepID=A0ABV6KGF0_9BACI